MGWAVMKRKNRRGSSEKEFPGWGGTLIVKVRLSMGCCIGAPLHRQAKVAVGTLVLQK